MNDHELENLIRQVIARLGESITSVSERDAPASEHGTSGVEHDATISERPRDGFNASEHGSAGVPGLSVSEHSETVDPQAIPDIGSIDLRREYLVGHPHDGQTFAEMKLRTPARVGVGHVGARHRTESMLRFQADHAAAQAAVFSDVPDEFLESLSLKTYQTRCQSRDEFLTRPDKGRVFPPETLEAIRQSVPKDCRVLIYMADGLSSSAVKANAQDILPVIREGLRGYGITCNEPFFVKYGRVGTMDALGDVIPADVICVLIGERPGLVTADSMSAYMAYRPKTGAPESIRTVLANIHAGGTPSVEAGAHIVDLVRLILEKKLSGVDLPV